MVSAHGSFIWYELLSPDPDASKAFYDAVVGWTMGPRPDGPFDYRMIVAPDGQTTGGLMHLSPEMAAGGARAGWLGYVAADDVDATAARLAELGGAVVMGPWEMPGVGRMAVVTDPWGAPFYLMHGAVEGATSTSFAPGVTGHVAWNELSARDLDGALAFYAALFGWESPERMAMPMGDYVFLDHAGQRSGAMAAAREGAPGGWTYYLRVDDVDAAAGRVTERRGRLMFGPYDSPGGDRIVMGEGPEGTASRWSGVGNRRDHARVAVSSTNVSAPTLLATSKVDSTSSDQNTPPIRIRHGSSAVSAALGTGTRLPVRTRRRTALSLGRRSDPPVGRI